jgi:hypothetical protein
MSDVQTLRLVRRYLDRTTDELPGEVTAALARARNRAITARSTDQYSTGGVWSLRWAIPAILVTCLGIVHFERRDTPIDPIAQTARIDTQVLTDDLPVDAYLEPGFIAWLDESSL